MFATKNINSNIISRQNCPSNQEDSIEKIAAN